MRKDVDVILVLVFRLESFFDNPVDLDVFVVIDQRWTLFQRSSKRRRDFRSHRSSVEPLDQMARDRSPIVNSSVFGENFTKNELQGKCEQFISQLLGYFFYFMMKWECFLWFIYPISSEISPHDESLPNAAESNNRLNYFLLVIRCVWDYFMSKPNESPNYEPRIAPEKQLSFAE